MISKLFKGIQYKYLPGDKYVSITRKQLVLEAQWKSIFQICEETVGVTGFHSYCGMGTKRGQSKWSESQQVLWRFIPHLGTGGIGLSATLTPMQHLCLKARRKELKFRDISAGNRKFSFHSWYNICVTLNPSGRACSVLISHVHLCLSFIICLWASLLLSPNILEAFLFFLYSV